jgi:hypothetical protein
MVTFFELKTLISLYDDMLSPDTPVVIDQSSMLESWLIPVQKVYVMLDADGISKLVIG